MGTSPTRASKLTAKNIRAAARATRAIRERRKRQNTTKVYAARTSSRQPPSVALVLKIENGWVIFDGS
jgi:hypothetical protein